MGNVNLFKSENPPPQKKKKTKNKKRDANRICVGEWKIIKPDMRDIDSRVFFREILLQSVTPHEYNARRR